MDPSRLGELLAAVGNQESKAVFFLSMEQDELYGISALHSRVLSQRDAQQRVDVPQLLTPAANAGMDYSGVPYHGRIGS